MEIKTEIGRLLLDDGTSFYGKSLSKNVNLRGELVFCTAMTGYQATFTDISYMGQILVMSSVEIGNVGINNYENQADVPTITGLVVKNISNEAVHYQAQLPLLEWLNLFDIPVLYDMETRSIIRKLVKYKKKPIASIKTGIYLQSETKNLQERTTYRKRSNLLKEESFNTKASANSVKVALIDFGFKRGILNNIRRYISKDCALVNGNSEHDIRILIEHYDAVDALIISNGPGDPRSYQKCIEALAIIKENKKPVLGICLGHQLLAMLYGCTIEELEYGHRSITHPVFECNTKKIMITSHNHGYVVSKKKLCKSSAITHISLFDKTIEGVRWDSKVMSVQFHPEGSPGTYESHAIFRQFKNLIDSSCA